MLITTYQLMKVCPNLDVKRATRLAELINMICPRYGITTKDILHEFLANVAHESGGFRHKDENMNYSASRIKAVWPSRFKTIAEASPYAMNPKKLANKVYGDRMGNRPGTDDGYNFRGGGFMGITGRDTYEKYRAFTAFDTVENVADAVRTDDYYAMDSAAWVFSEVKKLNDEAERDEFLKTVKAINGGYIGLEDRQKYYDRAKKFVI